MKNKFMFLLMVFLSSFAKAEDGCGLKDINDYGCHIIWFIYSLFISFFLILSIIILGYILKYFKVFKMKHSIKILNFKSIGFLLAFNEIRIALLSEYTIYGPDPIGRWNSLRDFTLIPLVATSIVYIIIFIGLKVFEKKKTSNEIG